MLSSSGVRHAQHHAQGTRLPILPPGHACPPLLQCSPQVLVRKRGAEDRSLWPGQGHLRQLVHGERRFVHGRHVPEIFRGCRS